MRDIGIALKSLDQILLFFALVVLFFISLSVFGISVTHSLSSMYSLGIAASFIFKNTASNVFDAIMFLFVSQYVVSSHLILLFEAKINVLVRLTRAIGASLIVSHHQ